MNNSEETGKYRFRVLSKDGQRYEDYSGHFETIEAAEKWLRINGSFFRDIMSRKLFLFKGSEQMYGL